MHNRFQSLPFHALAPAARHVRPRQQFPDTVTADTPAVFVMTDLRQVPAVTVNTHLNITQALERMQRKGVRMLFVTDQDDAVRGIITTTDILGERPLRIIQAGGGRRDDVLVSQVMTPHEQLDALDLNDVLRARRRHRRNPQGGRAATPAGGGRVRRTAHVGTWNIFSDSDWPSDERADRNPRPGAQLRRDRARAARLSKA